MHKSYKIYFWLPWGSHENSNIFWFPQTILASKVTSKGKSIRWLRFKYMHCKLMRSYQPGLKSWLKLWSNQLLIDFFDLKLSTCLIEMVATIWNRTLNLNPNSNIFKNLSNLIKNGQKRLNFQLILTFLIEFDYFQLNNWHQDDNFWFFNQKKIEIDPL